MLTGNQSGRWLSEQIAEIERRYLLNKEIVDLMAIEAKFKQIASIKTETPFVDCYQTLGKNESKVNI